jgi:serine/threonine protein phosphatase PrpC
LNLKPAGITADPEVKMQTIGPKDKFVILASDGVWDFVSNQEAVDIARRYPDPREASADIVKVARQRWKTQGGGGYIDDVTALVAKLHP